MSTNGITNQSLQTLMLPIAPAAPKRFFAPSSWRRRFARCRLQPGGWGTVARPPRVAARGFKQGSRHDWLMCVVARDSWRRGAKARQLHRGLYGAPASRGTWQAPRRRGRMHVANAGAPTSNDHLRAHKGTYKSNEPNHFKRGPAGGRVNPGVA